MWLHRLPSMRAHETQWVAPHARCRARLQVLAIVFSTCVASQVEADSPSACWPSSVSETSRSGRFVAWFKSEPREPSEGPDIRCPGPDLANYPNSSFTLPRLGFYLETTPFNMASSSELAPLSYNWEIFGRFGITDNIEARIYTGGLAVYDGSGSSRVGFLPLTFDTKLHLAKHWWRHFNFSLGLEAYVQTTWGSAGFTNGLQYAVNMLADHLLPWKLSYEWNLGFVRAFDSAGNQTFVPTFQGALQRVLIEDLAIFVQSYRNAGALPSAALSKGRGTGSERGTVFGLGLQWTVSDRWVLFGSFNVGIGPLAPLLSGNVGLAVSR